MTTRDQEERDLRIEQMTLSEKMRRDMRTETIKIVISTVAAAIALLGVGVALGGLIWRH